MYDIWLYFKCVDKCLVFLLLYIDGILLMGSDKDPLYDVQTTFDSQFEMKDLHEAYKTLGITLTRKRRCNGLLID